MANCKFGLNDHKPFISKKSVHHHHHDKSNHNFIEKEQYIHSHDHKEHVDNYHEHRGTDKKVLKWALSITLITMFLEFFYGFLSNSLALISDAIHMFTHSFALIISLFAIIIASKTAPISKTFGYYCKNRSKPDNDARVRPDAKTEFNRTVKRCSTGH